MTQTEQSRKFLDPRTISMLSDYRLLSRLIVDGFFLGHHRGPRNAFSLEYNKHRDYYPGDPLKLVDWKLFGKTDRYFVRQYEEETNLQAWLVMDISKSMAYQGEKGAVSKMQYASYLAAALAYLLLDQRDLVGMIQFDDKPRKVILPSSRRNQLNLILRELQGMQAGAVSHFEDAARFAASRIKKRGMVILFSDLLARPEEIEKTLKLFVCQGNDLLLFHVLTHEELRFPFRKFGFFQDLETRERVLLHPEYLHDEYTGHIKEYLESVKQICSKLKVSYQMLETTAPYDRALAAFLKLRSRLN